MQRVDTSQFRDPSSTGQGSNVVHPPQDQLTVDSIGIMESSCSGITELLPANAKAMRGQKSCFMERAIFTKAGYSML